MAGFARIPLALEARGHFFQMYGRDLGGLSENVAQFLAEGLRRGEAALVIGTAEHREAILFYLKKLGVNPEQSVGDASLLFLDSDQTLGQVMIGGQPDWELFDVFIGKTLDKLKAGGRTGIRGYGDMAGNLWEAREYEASIRLEKFWQTIFQRGGMSIFCSYPIDSLAEDFEQSSIEAVCANHTHQICV